MPLFMFVGDAEPPLAGWPQWIAVLHADGVVSDGWTVTDFVLIAPATITRGLVVAVVAVMHAGSGHPPGPMR